MNSLIKFPFRFLFLVPVKILLYLLGLFLILITPITYLFLVALLLSPVGWPILSDIKDKVNKNSTASNYFNMSFFWGVSIIKKMNEWIIFNS